MELQLGQDVKLTLEITQSLQENTSRIRATGLAIRNRTGTTVGSCWVLGEIRLGGALAANLILNNVQGCNLIYSGSWYQGGEDSWSGYSCQEVTVPHAADGTANLTAAASLRLYTTGNRFVDSFTRSGETALPRIPRATGLSAQPGPLGEPLALHLTRAAPGFRDTVTWQCGSQSGVLAEKTQADTLTWTPPLALATQQTQDTRVEVAFACTTYAGEETVGTGKFTLPLDIPGTVVPEVAVTVADALGYTESHGGYIQGQSRCQVTTRAAGPYGAGIREIAVTCGGLSGTGEQVCFALAHSGPVDITVTVTDSRGRTAAARERIEVLPYAAPTARIAAAYRCTPQGAPQADGLYLCLEFAAGATPVAGGKTTYRVRCRTQGTGEERLVALEEYENQFQAQGRVLLPAGEDSSYRCTLEVTDSFQTAASPAAFVGVAFVLLDFCRSSKSVGIGMRAQAPDTLSLALDTDLTGHRLLHLPTPQSPTDPATKEYVDQLFSQLQTKA